jgi:hypothetical protein
MTTVFGLVRRHAGAASYRPAGSVPTEAEPCRAGAGAGFCAAPASFGLFLPGVPTPLKRVCTNHVDAEWRRLRLLYSSFRLDVRPLTGYEPGRLSD